MRKYLEVLVLIIQSSAVLALLVLSLLGIYLERIASYGIALVIVIAPWIASELICNKPLIGIVESAILGYVLEQKKNKKTVDKEKLHAVWEPRIGIRMTKKIIENLAGLKLIKVKKNKGRECVLQCCFPNMEDKASRKFLNNGLNASLICAGML